MNGELRSPEDVFTWAESFTNLERGNLPFDKRNYRLDRMRRLLGLFDDPDSGLRIIHVAGTKGKGSTSALLASVLDASGRRTGLYTSPHVMSAFERIAIAGEGPRPDLLVRLGREVRQVIGTLPDAGLPGSFSPTTFELYTLLAFLYFREAGCEDAVIETGIGGRLDATNVVMSECSVITPLDLEHTEILGDTIEKIAFEKAGIIKPGAPSFVGFQPPVAKQVFRETARERGSPVTFLDEELESLSTTLDPGGTSFRLTLRGDGPRELRLSLLGEFQAENAALACLTLRRTRPEIPSSSYRDGLLAASLPGRMEVVKGEPPVVLDGAHTPLAVSRLVSSFDRIFPGEAVLLFGSVAGKRPREMAAILGQRFRRIIVSTPGTFKESDPEQVYQIFRAVNPGTILEKDPAAALALARRESGGKRPVLVTGSFYMVAEIRRLLA
ncbi:MAG TPA: folylpolyglutamate synthase/dihydrofolate synthase family protein [Spirochaetia bacterium]|nr:folylpolyglutamate synthase/dihydrofolate synthase family protein [Spirochaetia bacterium]